jgi:hypothetical protein
MVDRRDAGDGDVVDLRVQALNGDVEVAIEGEFDRLVQRQRDARARGRGGGRRRGLLRVACAAASLISSLMRAEEMSCAAAGIAPLSASAAVSISIVPVRVIACFSMSLG